MFQTHVQVVLILGLISSLTLQSPRALTKIWLRELITVPDGPGRYHKVIYSVWCSFQFDYQGFDNGELH